MTLTTKRRHPNDKLHNQDIAYPADIHAFQKIFFVRNERKI